MIMLINRSGTMVVPFMTLYLTSPAMGYSISQAGFVFGIFGIGAFSGAWIGGRLTDKIGFYPVQLITLFGGGIMFLVLGQMKTYPLICTFTFLLSFVNEAFRPANSTAIAFYSKESNRTRSYALNRLAINLGWAAGSALGGLLAHINYSLLFWVDGGTNIAAGILMWFTLKKNLNRKLFHKDQPDIKIRPVYQDKTYLYFITINIFFACCFFQLFTNLPVYFKKNLHFSEPYIGILMALNGLLIALVEMVLIYRLEGRRKELVYITIGVFIVGLSFLLLHVPGPASSIALLMIIMITLGEILAMPFMNSYWISRTHESNRGQYAALYTMTWAVAQTLGPVGGSQIADHFGFDMLWWVVGGIALAASFLYWKLYKKG
jgi:predicted MFS family arabinose efflux permease